MSVHSMNAARLAGALLALGTVGLTACTPSAHQHAASNARATSPAARVHAARVDTTGPLTFVTVSAKASTRMTAVFATMHGVQSTTYYPATKRLQVYLHSASAKDVSLITREAARLRTRR